MERARVYIRLSKFKEGDETLSPQTQLDLARSTCKARGWQLDEEASVRHQDLDVSGYSVEWRKRAGLTAHFADAKAGNFDRLLVPAIDRLGRNTADTLNAWDQFEGAGVNLYAIRENVDTSTSSGLLLRNILASVAEMESANTSARVKANVEARARAGRLHGGRLPSWLVREDGEIVINEPVADAVRLAVALRVEGHSYTHITRELNRRGHRTASGGKFQKSYLVKLFSWDWVDSMKGTAYTRRRGRFATDPRTGRRVSRGESIAIPDAYPPIIDERTWGRLQEFTTSHEQNEPTRDRASERWMLNGVFRCSVCGGRMGVHSRKRPDGTVRRTYFCESHDADPNAVPHVLSRVDGDMVELAVLVALDSLVKQIERESETVKTKPKMREESEVRRELDRVVSLYSKGTIDEEVLDQRVRVLNEEMDGIRRLASIPDEAPGAPALASRVTVRRWLQRNGVTVSYPAFVEGEEYAPNWRTGEAAPVPHAKVEYHDWHQTALLSPVFRNGVKLGRRKVRESEKTVQPYAFWPNIPAPTPSRVSRTYEVEVTDSMVALARG